MSLKLPIYKVGQTSDPMLAQYCLDSYILSKDLVKICVQNISLGKRYQLFSISEQILNKSLFVFLGELRKFFNNAPYFWSKVFLFLLSQSHYN
jgi:hypothetical protein